MLLLLLRELPCRSLFIQHGGSYCCCLHFCCRFLPQFSEAAKTGIALSLQGSFETTLKTMLVRAELIEPDFSVKGRVYVAENV